MRKKKKKKQSYQYGAFFRQKIGLFRPPFHFTGKATSGNSVILNNREYSVN